MGFPWAGRCEQFIQSDLETAIGMTSPVLLEDPSAPFHHAEVQQDEYFTTCVTDPPSVAVSFLQKGGCKRSGGQGCSWLPPGPTARGELSHCSFVHAKPPDTILHRDLTMLVSGKQNMAKRASS